MRLAEKVFAEAKGFFNFAWCLEDASVRCDPNNRAQNRRRQTESHIARYHAHKPRTAGRMLRQIRAKRVDQDVYIRQHHFKCFIRRTYSRSSISWSAGKPVGSRPGIGPPAALLTRGTTRFGFVTLRFSAITNRSPSAINDVRVRPSAAALRFARSRSSSGSRTVVLSVICLDIPPDDYMSKAETGHVLRRCASGHGVHKRAGSLMSRSGHGATAKQ
jgi:hypothetical protein